jgi:formylglycine-generating enzyme required for sulfatase activity
MKKYTILLLTVTVLHAMAMGSPEEIQPKTKVIRAASWYADQARNWALQARQNPADATAWLNYYLASRYSQVSAETLSEIATGAASALANTVEGKIITALNEGFTTRALQTLLDVNSARPDMAVIYGPLVLSHEWNLDAPGRKIFSKKLFASGAIAQSLLSYSYNVLMSIDKNAVLFVDGDNTTLPLFVLQDVMNIRSDVVILNLDLLQHEEYFLNKLKVSGLTKPELKLSDHRKEQMCKLIPEQNTSTKFYYALTVPRENVSSINDQLYVVGLASQLSKERLDNIALIKDNLENHFLLDYLAVDFNGENEFAAGRVLSPNYLVPMLLLYEQYVREGNRLKCEALEIIVTKVANETGKEILVGNFLKKNDDKLPFFPFAIDHKAIDGTMKMVSTTLYAQDHEITNEEFNTFLRYLAENKLDDLYEKYKFDLSAYQEPALSFLKGYSAAGTIPKKTKQRYPAVNVSFAAAEAYCEWLTEQYNNSADRKFKKVRFRLPKFNEWQIAAASIVNPVSWNLADNSAEVRIYANGKMAGKDFTKKTIQLSDPEVLFPWFRHYAFRNKPANSFGCYLGNFKIPETVKPCQAKMITPDGWMAMAPVQTYFPNDIGLFDMVGNVAEMLDESGKAAGGSWNHPTEESTIRSINEYKGPDSAIGFRIFMDIIEK